MQKIYHNNIVKGTNRIAKLKRRQVVLSVVRLLLFMLTLATPFLLYDAIDYWGLLAMVAPLILFMLLVKQYVKESERKRFELHKVEINKLEIEALQHRFTSFDEGSEFIDPDHMNAYDLDLFGHGSLFQFLNRTVTPKGKQKLAHQLKNPILQPLEIESRQEQVKELSEAIEWRQNFAAQGRMYAEKEEENNLFDSWGAQQFHLKSARQAKVLIPVLMVIGTLSLLVWIFAGNSALFSLALIIQVVVWMIEHKAIKEVNEQFGKRDKVLQKYGFLLQSIENHDWKSESGKAFIARLNAKGSPSKQIMKMRKIIASYDNRNNLLLGFIINLMFAWDYWHTYRLIKWHNANQGNYALWMNAIAHFDAVSSIANFSCNHPEYVYPKFTTGRFSIDAKEMGHPLIHPDKMKTNDFHLAGELQTIIVTGANMSGKSTFLRTVGVNMVLGMSGAPVCAMQMSFKPVEVFSNMRTTDSLFDDESYFFAELKRLQSILEEVDKGRELLIILDEILKGTNSVDKLHGSQKLLQRLVRQGTSSIIATHDLKLTELEQDYPENIKNMCFEITIENDEMQFDYQLRNGVTTIMNATFLMKKMGIID